MYYQKVVSTGWFLGPIMKDKFHMDISINANPIIEVYPYSCNPLWIPVEVYL